MKQLLRDFLVTLVGLSLVVITYSLIVGGIR